MAETTTKPDAAKATKGPAKPAPDKATQKLQSAHDKALRALDDHASKPGMAGATRTKLQSHATKMGALAAAEKAAWEALHPPEPAPATEGAPTAQSEAPCSE